MINLFTTTFIFPFCIMTLSVRIVGTFWVRPFVLAEHYVVFVVFANLSFAKSASYVSYISPQWYAPLCLYKVVSFVHNQRYPLKRIYVSPNVMLCSITPLANH